MAEKRKTDTNQETPDFGPYRDPNQVGSNMGSYLDPDSPLASTEISSIQQNKEKNIAALERGLKSRRPVGELIGQGIIMAQPGVYNAEKLKQLERARTTDMLKHKIEKRPNKQFLIDQHILKDNYFMSPLLVEKREILEKNQLKDSLNSKLTHRPGSLELVEKGVLKLNPLAHNLIRDGSISYPRVLGSDGTVPIEADESDIASSLEMGYSNSCSSVFDDEYQSTPLFNNHPSSSGQLYRQQAVDDDENSLGLLLSQHQTSTLSDYQTPAQTVQKPNHGYSNTYQQEKIDEVEEYDSTEEWLNYLDLDNGTSLSNEQTAAASTPSNFSAIPSQTTTSASFLVPCQIPHQIQSQQTIVDQQYELGQSTSTQISISSTSTNVEFSNLYSTISTSSGGASVSNNRRVATSGRAGKMKSKTEHVSKVGNFVFHNYNPIPKKQQLARERQQEEFIRLQDATACRNKLMTELEQEIRERDSPSVQSNVSIKPPPPPPPPPPKQATVSRKRQSDLPVFNSSNTSGVTGLEHLTVTQLKQECKQRNLPRSGTKTTLLRILEPYKSEIIRQNVNMLPISTTSTVNTSVVSPESSCCSTSLCSPTTTHAPATPQHMSGFNQQPPTPLQYQHILPVEQLNSGSIKHSTSAPQFETLQQSLPHVNSAEMAVAQPSSTQLYSSYCFAVPSPAAMSCHNQVSFGSDSAIHNNSSSNLQHTIKQETCDQQHIVLFTSPVQESTQNNNNIVAQVNEILVRREIPIQLVCSDSAKDIINFLQQQVKKLRESIIQNLQMTAHLKRKKGEVYPESISLTKERENLVNQYTLLTRLVLDLVNSRLEVLSNTLVGRLAATGGSGEDGDVENDARLEEISWLQGILKRSSSLTGTVTSTSILSDAGGHNSRSGTGFALGEEKMETGRGRSATESAITTCSPAKMDMLSMQRSWSDSQPNLGLPEAPPPPSLQQFQDHNSQQLRTRLLDSQEDEMLSIINTIIQDENNDSQINCGGQFQFDNNSSFESTSNMDFGDCGPHSNRFPVSSSVNTSAALSSQVKMENSGNVSAITNGFTNVISTSCLTPMSPMQVDNMDIDASTISSVQSQNSLFPPYTTSPNLQPQLQQPTFNHFQMTQPSSTGVMTSSINASSHLSANQQFLFDFPTDMYGFGSSSNRFSVNCSGSEQILTPGTEKVLYQTLAQNSMDTNDNEVFLDINH